MKPAALDCPSFMWASTYLSVTALMLLLTHAQAPVSSVLVGALLGALALEFSVFKGGECSWLPEALPTKALFHLLALILGFVVLLPAFGAIQHGGLLPLIPGLLALSLAAFFFIHLRQHAGPPQSERPVPLALHLLAALPFFVLTAGGVGLVVLVLLALLRKAGAS